MAPRWTVPEACVTTVLNLAPQADHLKSNAAAVHEQESEGAVMHEEELTIHAVNRKKPAARKHERLGGLQQWVEEVCKRLHQSS